MVYSIQKDGTLLKPKLPQKGHYFISPSADVIGHVELGEYVSLWPQVVLRGDEGRISLGEMTNVQDGTVLHGDNGTGPTVGSYVTIGHRAIIHACEISDYALIGMGATILSFAKIGKGAIIAAGAVVKEGAEIPDFALVVGVPGVVKRIMDPSSLESRKHHAEGYWKQGLDHLNSLSEIEPTSLES